ncbi:hypothetical protein ACFSTI_02835 [Rhizorhabdus histidinilytica]
MSVFLRHAAGVDLPAPPAGPAFETPDATLAAAREWVQVMCDEALLDPGADGGDRGDETA